MILGLPLALSGSAKRGGLPVTNGLKLFLIADKGITIGTGVSAWADQSGNGNDVSQGTPASQPAFVSSWRNGKAALQGASGKSLARASFTGGAIAQPMTMVVAGSWAPTPTTVMIDGTGASNRTLVGKDTGGLWAHGHDSFGPGVGTANTADVPFYAISDFTSPESTSLARIVALSKGAEQGTSDPGGVEQTMTGITVGATYVPSNNWDGKIAMVLIYSRILTNSEKSALESWVRNYYGI